MTQAAAPADPHASSEGVRFKSRATRRLKDRLFVAVCLVAASTSIATLVTLLTSIIAQAMGFTFDHWSYSLVLGVMVLTVSSSLITIGVNLPGLADAKVRRRKMIILLAASGILLASVAVLAQLWQIRQGKMWLTWDFLIGVPSRFPDQAGIWPAMIGTLLICLVCALSAIPIGVATAILLEEFRPRRRWLAKAHAFVQLNITNLAGVPSIVYGILGLTLFVQLFNAFGTPLNPSFEFGISRYDRFLTEGGQFLQVPVADREAPPTDPTTIDNWETPEGQPVDVELMDRQAFLSRDQAFRQQYADFEDAIEDALDATPPPSVLDLAATIEQAWQDAELEADVDEVKDEIAARLFTSQQMGRREARRERRQAIRLAEQAERAVRFPGILLTDSVPSRVSETAPWYLRIPLGRGVLAGGLTLMLVVLPIVIISAQEALRAVPRSMRYASLALGATPWQTVWKITLPTAVPGIMTGTILAMSRAIGEAAPILVIAGIVYITFTPSHLMDDFTAMPLQIFNWAGRPQADFHAVAAAGIIVLMAILLLFNAVAVIIRQRTQKQY